MYAILKTSTGKLIAKSNAENLTWLNAGNRFFRTMKIHALMSRQC